MYRTVLAPGNYGTDTRSYAVGVINFRIRDITTGGVIRRDALNPRHQNGISPARPTIGKYNASEMQKK